MFTTFPYTLVGIVGIIAVAGGYYWFSQTKIESLELELSNTKLKLSAAVANYDSCVVSKRRTIEARDKLAVRNQNIQRDVDRYLEIFKKHDLTKLSKAKPGLIENRVNSGTKKLLEGIENETSNSNP